MTTTAQPDPTPPTPEPEPGQVDLADAGAAGWVFVLRQIRQKRAELDTAEQHAKEQIQAALGDLVDGTIDGKPVVRWSHTAAPRRFNKKAFTKAHPALALKYTELGQPGRRFELLDPTGGDQ